MACDADVLLAGHLHAPHACRVTERHRIQGHIALIVQAGTATSTRGRGQPNSFNVLRVERPAIDVRRYDWSSEGGAFLLAEESKFVHGSSGWQPVAPSTNAGERAPGERGPRSPPA
jgi:hypothetical protein